METEKKEEQNERSGIYHAGMSADTFYHGFTDKKNFFAAGPVIEPFCNGVSFLGK